MPTTSEADAIKERTALFSIVMDLVQIVPSVIVAAMANSLTLYADVIGDFNVLFANIMLWIILHAVRKGMVGYYDYGAGKIENLIGVIGAVFVVFSIGYIIYTSINRLFAPVQLEIVATLWGALVMFLSMVMYGYVWFRNYRIYKILPSPVTEIQWRVPMSNALIGAGILTALLAAVGFRQYRWSLYIDPVVSLILGAYIIFTFYGLIKTSLFDLLDRTLDENHQMIITRELVVFFDEYRHLHGVRSRQTGGKIFIEIFLEFDPDRKMGEVQQVAEAMRNSLQEKIENSFVSISLAKAPLHGL